VIDVSNLTWRNWYAMRGSSDCVSPSYKNLLVFGLLRDLGTLTRVLGSDRFIFCFEGSKLIRREVFPKYKPKVNHPDAKEVNGQIAILRKDVLPRLGYNNLLIDDELEADDLIAMVAENYDCYIISNDTDLYQCLRDGVRMWKPIGKQLYSYHDLYEQFGLAAHEWVKYKALTGCESDGIPGIQGIGFRKAVDYITGKEGRWRDRCMRDIAGHHKEIELYERLVKLPFDGKVDYQKIQPATDMMNADVWNVVMERLGFRTLLNRAPLVGVH
jgi:DNA polymerase-1